MSHETLVQLSVAVMVTDPWDFGTACGAGPFTGTVAVASRDEIVVRLSHPLVYLGRSISTIIARPRHVGDSMEALLEGVLPANLVLQSVDASLDPQTASAAIEFIAIGSVAIRN